jgi:hypothetical protein
VGPFSFAWVDAGTAFDSVAHKREDEKIVRWRVEHLETEFATLSVDIRNPRRGLLTGQLWAWLSWDNAGTMVPLFFGRLVALPSNLHREIVTVQFLARPEDFGLQKAALAATMREPPYYDPVFIKPEMVDDPDIVLEGRTQVWHIDRTTHEVTVSDLLVGEDGVAEFGEDEVPYDSVEISLDQPPVRAVAVQAEVPWTQGVRGRGVMMFRNWKVPTLAGKGVIEGWPKPSQDIGGAQLSGSGRFELIKGDDLGGGWFADQSSALSPYMNLTDGDWSWWFIRNYAPQPQNKNPLIGFKPPPFAVSIIQSYSASVPRTGKVTSSSTRFAIIDDVAFCNLTMGYEAERKRKDTIRFTLIADSQPIVTMPDDDDVIELKIAGNDVGLPVATGPSPLPSPPPEPPIGSPLRRSYFTTDRGMLSIQYAIQMARARIVARSRAVSLKWKCRFDRAIALSLRQNALVHDRRLPGGEAVGKIVAYSFGADGGEISGECSIACCIGYGGAIDEAAGAPCYVDGYVDGYQHHDGQRVVLAASDVGFEPLRENANDDGLVFPLRAAPVTQPPHNVTVEKTPLAPVTALSQASTQVDDCGDTSSVSVSQTVDTGPYTNWLSGIETTVQFQMKAVEGGPFESVYDVVVTDLKLPKQIDLEAPATP